MTAVSFLANQWRSAGVEDGDTLLVHSNVFKTLSLLRRNNYPPSISVVLDSFLEAVGKNGTLLFPLFNFDFTQGTPFDINKTPSHMGALTEEARLRPESVRTGHPIYSFAVLGHHASIFENVNNQSGYGEDSPFGILRKIGGKIAALNLEDQHCMTFYHHIEEMNQVDYRYFKTFTGPYTDKSGKCNERSYSLYVRDLDRGVKTHLQPMEEMIWAAGLYSGARPTESHGLRVVNATRMFDFVSDVIRSGHALGNLYTIDKS